MEMTFPGATWQRLSASDAGFDTDKLAAVDSWLTEVAGGSDYRVVITRYGRLVDEWYHGIDADAQHGQASASKSYFSSMIGIAVEEGVIPSPDAKVIDSYPEMMDIGEDEGPKPGRYPFEKDRNVTFRQCICNTSGYMKPDEEPGKIFHYQTFGMNLVTNGLATAYGLYDSSDPDRLPGFSKLVEEKIRDRIGGTWTHGYTDFDHAPQAKKNIFGHSARIVASALDTARMGVLWLNGGNWDGTQVIPGDYLKEAVVTNPDILKNEPEENWKYGHGFWVNDHGKQWPDLPRDSYAASGAGAKHVWVCPSLALVISMNPGAYNGMAEGTKVTHLNDAHARILDALTG
jgi:CubicO group peptidase (beta-lactamase class C family)